ncbi:MAG: hypothetical protein J6A28_02870 [Clostridia bacterium]|nr:hypothetical protein [Clostridia bacterium]
MSNNITKSDIYTYLTSSREAVINKLQEQTVAMDNIKPILKKALYKYVKDDIGKIDASVYCVPMCTLVEQFSLKDFTNRVWVYKPSFMAESDYNKLRGLRKIPLLIKEHNNTNNIYTFPNKISIASTTKYEKVFVEPQFYTNEDDNIMFGKLMRLKYVPKNAKVVDLLDKSKEIVQYSHDDQSLFDKVMSISFCVIIEGDCTKAIPLYRYDSSRLEHTNLYIGDDKRREIFGEVVHSPHFHFQNEDDSLLCLRKYHKNNNKDHLYKSGRCNAIDCKHLRKYLIDLDTMPRPAIEKLNSHNKNYGMPFLKMRYEEKVAQCNFIKGVNKYLKALDQETRKKLSCVEKWIGKAHGERFDVEANEYVSYDYYPIFGELIKAVDFIDFLFNCRQNCVDCKVSKHLAELELLTANMAINCFAGVASSRELKEEGLDLNERVFLDNDESLNANN